MPIFKNVLRCTFLHKTGGGEALSESIAGGLSGNKYTVLI
jgi:hypothetical protein